MVWHYTVTICSTTIAVQNYTCMQVYGPWNICVVGSGDNHHLSSPSFIQAHQSQLYHIHFGRHFRRRLMDLRAAVLLHILDTNTSQTYFMWMVSLENSHVGCTMQLMFYEHNTLIGKSDKGFIWCSSNWNVSHQFLMSWMIFLQPMWLWMTRVFKKLCAVFLYVES